MPHPVSVAQLLSRTSLPAPCPLRCRAALANRGPAWAGLHLVVWGGFWDNLLLVLTIADAVKIAGSPERPGLHPGAGTR